MTLLFVFFFFFNDTATTEIYTLSLHDALPIWSASGSRERRTACSCSLADFSGVCSPKRSRSEEHTSELQSRFDLVCRLLLEKKNILLLCLTRLTQHSPKPHPSRRYRLLCSH